MASANQGIVLIGMMGSGKTAVGKRLAKRLEMPHYDTDKLVRWISGWSISEAFEKYGEAVFRKLESKALQRFRTTEPCVLSTGGGIVTVAENWPLLSAVGSIVYLDVPIDVLEERVQAQRSERPLLSEDDWQARMREILLKRDPMYRQADFTIEVGKMDVDEVVEQVIKVVGAD